MYTYQILSMSVALPILEVTPILPSPPAEEFVLVEWLTEQAEAGQPAGAFLPLFFMQRARVGEAMTAWRK